MNTYIKYCPTVFVALCENMHEKGETVIVTTRYGAEHEVTIFNFLGKRKQDDQEKFMFSVIRNDGFNYQEFCKRRAERRLEWAGIASTKSEAAYEASNEGADFLSLGEPIKIGHHSEKRHRALIERNHARMARSVEQSKLAEYHAAKAAYWEAKQNDINLSMPESVEYFEHKLEVAKATHQGLKDGSLPRVHSYSLTYAKKEVNELTKKLELARKLWG